MAPDWVAITAIATGCAVVVSLILFIWESRQRVARDRRERRHEAVSRVLDTMEIAVRKQQRPIFVRVWSKAELDYALAVPRLRHNLEDLDVALPRWAMRRTQEMLDACSDKESREIGIDIGSKLVEWSHGTIPTQWFANQLAERPLRQNFKRSRSKSFVRGLRQGVESFKFGAAVGGALVVLFSVWHWSIGRRT